MKSRVKQVGLVQINDFTVSLSTCDDSPLTECYSDDQCALLITTGKYKF
jgi:hypothetical protein